MFNILAAIALSFAVQASTPPSETTLLVFGGRHCRPCREMDTLVARLDARRVRKIDADADEVAVRRWHVDATPTFIAVRGDREIGRIRGKTTFERLRRLLGRDEPEKAPEVAAPVVEPTPADHSVVKEPAKAEPKRRTRRRG